MNNEKQKENRMDTKALVSFRKRIKRANATFSVAELMLIVFELETYSLADLNTLKYYLKASKELKGFENQLNGIIRRVEKNLV